MAQQDLLAKTLVELADNLVTEFDVVDLMSLLADRSVELLDASAAGLMLVDSRGSLQVMAASTEAVHLLELFQLQNEEGPCLDSFQSGRPVTAYDLHEENRWPRFSVEAVAAGFRSVYAFPMRLRNQVIGALNLFRTGASRLNESDVLLAQAMADVATITVLQERVTRDAHALSEQLQFALNSRIVIEQAKGVVAEQAGVPVEEAFVLLRTHARRNNRRLTELADDVINGRVSIVAKGPVAGSS